MNRKIGFASLMLATALVAGCNRTEPPAEWRPTMTNPAVSEPATGAPKSVPDMADDDVIVAVNGIPLTKRDIDLKLASYRLNLQRTPHMKGRQLEAIYRKYGRELINRFVNTQTVLWEARKSCRLNEQEILARAATNLVATAKSLGGTPESMESRFPGWQNMVNRAAEEKMWEDAYLKANIHIETNDLDGVVAEIKREIDRQNDEIAATNAVVKSRLNALRDRIVKGGESFGALANQNTEDTAQDNEDGTGFWGEFTLEGVDNAALRQQLPSMGLGDITEVLPDGSGFMIVQLLDRTGDGSYKLARIYLEGQEPIELAEDDAGIRQGIVQKRTQKEIARLLADLKARNTVAVVYPHGTNFWGTVNTKARKARKEAK